MYRDLLNLLSAYYTILECTDSSWQTHITLQTIPTTTGAGGDLLRRNSKHSASPTPIPSLFLPSAYLCCCCFSSLSFTASSFTTLHPTVFTFTHSTPFYLPYPLPALLWIEGLLVVFIPSRPYMERIWSCRLKHNAAWLQPAAQPIIQTTTTH